MAGEREQELRGEEMLVVKHQGVAAEAVPVAVIDAFQGLHVVAVLHLVGACDLELVILGNGKPQRA